MIRALHHSSGMIPLSKSPCSRWKVVGSRCKDNALKRVGGMLSGPVHWELLILESAVKQQLGDERLLRRVQAGWGCYLCPWLLVAQLGIVVGCGTDSTERGVSRLKQEPFMDER